jgi:hypothetical protein
VNSGLDFGASKDFSAEDTACSILLDAVSVGEVTCGNLVFAVSFGSAAGGGMFSETCLVTATGVITGVASAGAGFFAFRRPSR